MKTSALLTVTALTAVTLLSSDFTAPAHAMKFKPQTHGIKNNVKIRPRVVRPRVRVRTNTKRLVKKKQTKRTVRRTNEAGAKATARKKRPQRTVTANAALTNAPLPREKPSRLGEADIGGWSTVSGMASLGFGLHRPVELTLVTASDRLDNDTARRVAEIGQLGLTKDELAAIGEIMRLGDHDGSLQMIGIGGDETGTQTPGDQFGDANPVDNWRGLNDASQGRDIAGVGSGIFNFIGNSHQSDAPDTGHVAVTPGSIAWAMGGVAGDKNSEGSEVRHTPYGSSQGSDAGYRTDHRGTDKGYRTFWTDPDGTRHEVLRVVNADGSDHTRHDVITPGTVTTSDGATHRTTVQEPGRTRVEGRTGDDVANAQIERSGSHAGNGNSATPREAIEAQGGGTSAGGSAAELRNPDHDGGGGYVPPNCGAIECIKPKGGIQTATKGPGAMPQAPEHVTPGTQTHRAPIVSKQDLTAKYDPDSQNGGGSSGPTKTHSGPGPMPPDPNG